MIVNINYGNRVVVLPTSAIESFADATASDIKVLLAVAAKNSGNISDIKIIAD
jgi:hypothetical protein